MNAGTIDHETGTRDIVRLGGLARLMPVSAVLGTLAAAAMAGLPPLNGFISKEMMLEQALHTRLAGRDWLVPVLAVVASTLSVAYSLRYAVLLYFGRPRGETLRPAHEPGAAMTWPPVMLVALVVVIGLLPMPVAGPLVIAVAGAVTAGSPPETDLALWHGINPALGASLVAVVAGAALLWPLPRLAAVHARATLPDAKRLFDAAMAGSVGGARRLTSALHVPSLQRTLFVTFATIVALAVEAVVTASAGPATRTTLPTTPVALVAWTLLVVATGAVVAMERHRFVALILVSVVGLIVALGTRRSNGP